MQKSTRNLVAGGVGFVAGNYVQGRLAERKLFKGPGLITTLGHLCGALFLTFLFSPLGGLWTLYAANRLTRRIGQVGLYAVSGRECLRWAANNRTIWVIGPFLACALLGILNDQIWGVAVLLWIAVVGVAVYNGVQINKELKTELAAERLSGFEIG